MPSKQALFFRNMDKLFKNKGVTFPKGFMASGIACGLKRSGKPDLAILFTKKKAKAVGAFTTNLFKAAPVLLCMKHIKRNKAHAIIVNSGNANSYTGKTGVTNAIRMAHCTARSLNINPRDVLVCSTGVIGHQLPVKKITGRIPHLPEKLSANGGLDFARAIMTTDTVPKQAAAEIIISGKKIRIGGACKGSGMINPNLATMLAFITTDANIYLPFLKSAFRMAVKQSFNSISVDGDMSTNDCVLLLANGAAENAEIRANSKYSALFQNALSEVMQSLAKQIARDGEGATKLIEINVKGLKNKFSAEKIARSIGCSNLVKTAFYGNDPNWGRIICAVGYAGVKLNTSKLCLCIQGKNILKNGKILNYNAKSVSNAMDKDVVSILINFNSGPHSARFWACDMGYDYIKINAEYNT